SARSERPGRIPFWLLPALLLGAGIFLAAAGSLPADPASAEAKRTIGPGVFTFPEIARQLSVDGRVVRIHPGLENSAALVYLKERPWSKARALLSAGLDLRFRPVQGHEKRWEMDRDPVVAEREARWRRELTVNLYEQLRANWQERQIHPLQGNNSPGTRL